MLQLAVKFRNSALQNLKQNMSLQNQTQRNRCSAGNAFSANGNIDFNALGKVIDFVIEGGVEYVVSLGTTGETPTLEKRKKKTLCFTFDKVAARVPVVVGIGGNNTRELIKDVETFPLKKPPQF